MTTDPRDGFFQDPPRLHDEWADDTALRAYLRRVLPPDVLADVTPSLAAMGRLAAGDLNDLAVQLDRREHEPRLVAYDAWGQRIDRIETAPAWSAIGRVAAEHGVVATAYERAHGEHSRLHQFALAYLFAPSSGLYSCPLAMTDGAARTLSAHASPELVARAVPRLTSRDPDVMWTSGQWMTERTGGSDVGLSETVAVKDGDVWRLRGTKWFTSATTADVALTLARPEGNPAGGRGLALFYVELRDDYGRWNDIEVLRLKDKLGTRQMPTAELALLGTAATLVGDARDGIRNIVPMLAITRLWNAVSSVAGMRRALALARDYARRRTQFGRLLVEQPAHQATLAWMRVQHEAALQLTFRAAQLLGRVEAATATAAEVQTLRILLPIAKLVTAKQAVAVASEALEAFGGAGYVEDTHLPVLLRDAQVLPIWEGTTNVLSLDVLRALHRDDAFAPLVEEVRRIAAETDHPDAVAVARAATDAIAHATAWLDEAAGSEAPRASLEHGARRFATTLGRAVQAVSLAAQAEHDLRVLHDGRGLAVARRFAAEGVDVIEPAGRFVSTDARLAEDAPIALPGASAATLGATRGEQP